MAYSSFNKLKKVTEVFGLTLKRENIFEIKDIQPVMPSQLLLDNLAISDYLGFFTEKERSERLVHPILAEIAVNNRNQITFYSGQEINVDTKRGLSGECDYLMSLGKKVIDFVQTPVFSVVEAKKQDIEHGVAQCTAQMIGARLYNEQDNIHLPYLYGATTEGQKWRFIKLEGNTLTINEDYYTTHNLPLLLGFLQTIVEDMKKISE